MNNYFKHLPWDSNLLGFEVGKFEHPISSFASFQLHVQSIPKEVDLVYMLTHRDFKLITNHHESFLIQNVSAKVTLSRKVNKDEGDNGESLIHPFPRRTATDELLDLSIRSGLYSRFKQDPFIPIGKFEDLYRQWIENSVSGKIADAVLVSTSQAEITGMVSLRVFGTTASIGLLSVAENHVRKGIASNLLNAANRWANSQGCLLLTVVTQQQNKGALNLYQKSGFQITSIEPFFHLWRKSMINSNNNIK